MPNLGLSILHILQQQIYHHLLLPALFLCLHLRVTFLLLKSEGTLLSSRFLGARLISPNFSSLPGGHMNLSILLSPYRQWKLYFVLSQSGILDVSFKMGTDHSLAVPILVAVYEGNSSDAHLVS